MTDAVETAGNASVLRVLAVVVLYKLAPERSPTVRTLLKASETICQQEIDLTILVWDNTPGKQGPASERFRYIAAPANVGLGEAYNAATRIALEEGMEWMLTLDQDSVLPAGFLQDLAACIHGTTSHSVAAVVPVVSDGGRVISPYRMLAGAVPRWYPAGYKGVPQTATYAVNSGALLRVAALQAVGGYDPLFPLDLSDINMFHTLHTAGFRVRICGDVHMQHELALLARSSRMNVARYRAGLLDECAFYDRSLGPLARCERLVRLAVRACKDWARPGFRVFGSMAAAEVWRRLCTRRSVRVKTWTRWAEERAGFEDDVVRVKELSKA